MSLFLIAALTNALASGQGSAVASVAGPVSLRLRTVAARVEITASDAPAVRVALPDSPGRLVRILFAGADRIDVDLGVEPKSPGRVRIELPRKSRLDLGSAQGAISASGVDGDVRVRTSSGDVSVEGAAAVDVETIDGRVRIGAAQGPLRIHTVSGAIAISSKNPALQLDVETASGQIEWEGACARGCRADVESVSGAVRLKPALPSSFELHFATHSGALRDEGRALAPVEGGRGKHSWRRARLGSGEGVVECETFSGDLVVR